MRAKKTHPQSIYLEKRFYRPQLRCPLWVKNGHQGTFDQCPLYPQMRIEPRSFGRRGAGVALHLSRAARHERSHGRSCRGYQRPYRSEPTLSIRPRPHYARLILN